MPNLATRKICHQTIDTTLHCRSGISISPLRKLSKIAFLIFDLKKKDILQILKWTKQQQIFSFVPKSEKCFVMKQLKSTLQEKFLMGFESLSYQCCGNWGESNQSFGIFTISIYVNQCHEHCRRPRKLLAVVLYDLL